MAQKIIAVTLLSFLLAGCGGSSFNPINPPVVKASAPDFPPAQPKVCNGDPFTPGGMSCMVSDGKTIYQLWHWSVAVRPDGHGTFMLSTEQGIRAVGLYEITVDFPAVVNIAEVHPTLNLVSYCAGNGFETKIEGASVPSVQESIVGAKTVTLDTAGSPNIPVPQTVFPVPVPVSHLYLYTYNDLCATSTVSWDIHGSF